MNRLLKVSARRLVKDKILYICCAIVLLLSLYQSLSNAPTVAEWAETEDDCNLESFFYNLVPILGMFYAAFTTLFIGVEYSDGTLRNKIIAGHSRNSIYLSFFAISFAGCMMITLSWLLGALPGFKYFDSFSYSWGDFALVLVVIAGSAMTYAALFTLVSMLNKNKALSSVIALGLWFALLFLGSSLVNILDAPPLIDTYTYGDNGVPTGSSKVPNPDYVDGMTRSVLETISHIFPICPAIRLSNGELGKPVIDILWYIGTTALVLLGGMTVFNKKDIK